MLQTASPDAIARLAATKLKHDAEDLWTEYFENQKHGSLKDYLVHCLGNNHGTDEYGSLVQVGFLIYIELNVIPLFWHKRSERNDIVYGANCFNAFLFLKTIILIG